MQFIFLYRNPFPDSSPYLWCGANPAVSPCTPGLTGSISFSTIREKVTSHHHPEVFPGRSVMSMVEVLPPHSWVLPGYLHAPSPHHPLPSPQSPEPVEELPSSSPGTHRVSLATRDVPSAVLRQVRHEPLAMGHLGSRGHLVQGTASAELRWWVNTKPVVFC